jgi:hypothetical protein
LQGNLVTPKHTSGISSVGAELYRRGDGIATSTETCRRFVDVPNGSGFSSKGVDGTVGVAGEEGSESAMFSREDDEDVERLMAKSPRVKEVKRDLAVWDWGILVDCD